MSNGVDPGIVILYSDEDEVHDVLGLNNSPIHQGTLIHVHIHVSLAKCIIIKCKTIFTKMVKDVGN